MGFTHKITGNHHKASSFSVLALILICLDKPFGVVTKKDFERYSYFFFSVIIATPIFYPLRIGVPKGVLFMVCLVLMAVRAGGIALVFCIFSVISIKTATIMPFFTVINMVITAPINYKNYMFVKKIQLFFLLI